MDKSLSMIDKPADSRIHWTARVSCGFSVYTALGFLTPIVSLFFPATPLSQLLLLLPARVLLNLPAYLLSFLFTPFHQLLPPLVLAFLPSFLFSLILLVFACIALFISGKPAWRKGQKLAIISMVLVGIMFVLKGTLVACLYLLLLSNVD